MRHPIGPKIDCVFKALLGAEANRRLLIHFLNAVLGADLPAPVAEVEILNPYNEREFLDDKLSIVDVKARDGQGRIFQVEIQLLIPPELLARILYGWADLVGRVRRARHAASSRRRWSTRAVTRHSCGARRVTLR
jgi:predicted transposase/invertase (TIGR01784 family)